MASDTQGAVQASSVRKRHTSAIVELNKYRLLVESVQDYAIFLLDQNGFVRTWNEGAKRYKGYQPHEIIGKHFSVFYLERDKKAKKPERELELAKRFGRVEDEDWRVRKDGSQFWASVVITALYDDTGNLVGFGKVTRDLTERKYHEDELRRANHMLKQQQRELQQLNTSKDEFISLASHQLRTPATSIKQFLGMVLEGFAGEVPPAQLEYLTRAYESNEHQIAIVNSLLKVAQVDAGKVLLKKVPTNLAKLIADVVEEHADQFKRRKQQVTTKVAPGLPFALVDIGHFRMVLENLIDNASKYTPHQGKISVRADLADNDMIRLAIQDNGVGVTAENIPRLFEKFNRIPNALSDEVGGSGLGLYWVQKIIALHGGRIEVASEIDKGTTFTLYIPAGPAHA